MSQVVERLDPALKKLLDELPEGDPDKEPEEPPMAVVYSPWIEGQIIVPVNQQFEEVLGEWMGPEMLIKDIPIYAVIQGTNRRQTVTPTYNFLATIYPHHTLTVTGIVNYEP